MSSVARVAPPARTSHSFVPKKIGKYSIPTLKFNGDSLKQNSVSFAHGNVVNSYISYEKDAWWRDLSTDFTRGKCLFEAVKLTKNIDFDKYGYNDYGIVFDACSRFSWSDGSWGKTVLSW